MRKLTEEQVKELKSKGARVKVVKKAKPKTTSQIKSPTPAPAIPDTVPELKAMVKNLQNTVEVLGRMVEVLKEDRTFPKPGDTLEVIDWNEDGRISKVRIGDIVAGITH